MASSVSSAKEMERWARERREKAQRTVAVSQASSRSFNSFVPDFEQLAKYEQKAQQLAERQEDREHELEVEPVINVMGSTAGAGSGCAATHTRRSSLAQRDATRLLRLRLCAHHACVRGGAGTSTRIAGTAPRRWRA